MSDDCHCLKMRLALLLREKTMPSSRELDMKEIASNSPQKDFQPAESPIEYEIVSLVVLPPNGLMTFAMHVRSCQRWIVLRQNSLLRLG